MKAFFMSEFAENNAALNNLQLELLKCLKYIRSNEQVEEVKSLFRYYFAQKLDIAIDKMESANNYSAVVYQGWLKSETV